MRLALILSIAALLAGCTTTGNRSWVTPTLTAAEAETLAADSVWYLERPFPPAATSFVLDGSGNLLTDKLAGELREAGYGVLEQSAEGSTAIPLTVQASDFEGGLLLRLNWQSGRAARFYPRAADGSLATNLPFTTESEQ